MKGDNRMRLIYAVLVAAIPSAPAFALSCDPLNLRLEGLSKRTSAHIDHPTDLRVGGQNGIVTFDWAINADRIPDDFPTYLIVSSSTPVRFYGEGFLALSADATGPSGIAFGEHQDRAIVPLHNPIAAMHGSLKIQMLRARETDVRWALVTSTACGERIAAQDKSTFTVAANLPHILIQDPYDLEKPDQIINSNDGHHRLHVFADRFRVFNVDTGSLVLDAEGREPNFSPTGRFLAAYQGGRDSRILNLFDLASGVTIGAVTGPALIWQNGDSIAIAGSEVYERVAVLQTLINDISPGARSIDQDGGELCTNGFATSCHPPAPLLADYEGCNGCGAAWSEISVAISYDTGVVGRWSSADGHGWRRTLYSLGFAISTPVPVKPYATFMSDRTREVPRPTIDRLGRLAPGRPSAVLADGRTSHAPAADWQATASGSDADIAGARELRARLTLHRSETAAGTSAGGTGQLGQHAQKPAVNPQTPVPYVLFEQLTDVGLKLARGSLLRNAVMSVVTTDNNYHVAQVSPSLDKLLTPFLTRMDYDLLDATADCHLLDLQLQHEQPDWGRANVFVNKPKLVAKCADGLWSFSRETKEYLIGQTLSPYGTDHENIYTNTYLLIIEPDEPLRLIYLNKNFLPTHMPMYERGPAGFFWPGNLHQINFVAQRYLIFASPGEKTAHVFDLETLAPLGKPVALVDADLLNSVQLSNDAAHLLQINSDGRLEVSRLADGQSILSGRTTDDELLLALPDGRFDGTPEGAHFVNLAFDGDSGLYSFQQFERSLKTPGIVLAALEGRTKAYKTDVAPPPSVDLDLRSEEANRFIAEIHARSVVGLQRLRIMLDGVPVLEKPLMGHDQKLALEISNLGDGRTVTALAADTNGALSRAISRPLKQVAPPKATLRVLTVGIDDYRGQGFPPLSSAVADAGAIRTALEKGNGQLFADRDIRAALVNEMATPDAIRANLESLVVAAKPGDTIVFAFAGHGVADRSGQLRLATYQATLETIGINSVGWDEIAAILSRAPTRVVVLLDACHAGNANFDQLAKNENMVKALLSGVRAPILIFAASKGRELSRERDGSGVFTRAIVETLRGRSAADPNNNGLIDVDELYVGVKRNVVAATGGQQTPWLARGDLLGSFPLFERLDN